jgi:Tol biopolymer transport system component/DNA-binding winged helix-turn-helix (wHTH) protein
LAGPLRDGVIGGPIYEFGDVRVDAARMIVTRADAIVELEPKAFDVLHFLIEHRDRLVTKGELLDTVWRDTFVTPNVLTRAVAQLRKAIGDDAHESRYIETVAKRGYRFIAPVIVGAGQPVVAPSGSVALQESPKPPTAPLTMTSTRQLLLIGAVVLLIAGAAAAFFALRAPTRDSATSVTAFPNVRRLFGSNLGYYGEPTLSPDGQSIAYTSDKSGGLEIYVSGIVQGSREIAITNDGGQNEQPQWSPDGQWIAYHSRLHGGVWIVSTTGGVARQIVEFGSQPSWSPDSRSLAFASYEGAIAAQSVIWIVRNDGTDRRQLTRPGSPSGGHLMPSWSHDGRHVVFGRFDGGRTTDLWIVGVGNSMLKKLAGSSPVVADVFWRSQFGADDSALYFAGATPDGNGRIFKLAIDHDTFEPVGQPQPVFAYVDALPSGFAIPSSGSAVYGLYQEDSNLWAIDWPAAGEPTRLTDGKRNFRAAYSRDGRVAYMNQDVGQGFTIWLMGGDGSGRQPLVPNLRGFNPQWSSDGTRVLVLASVTADDSSFDWVDVATRRVTAASFQGGRMGEPRLSPSGDDFVFHVVGETGALNLWRQPLTGGRRVQITFDPETISYPTWSPDGRSIAAEMKRGNDTHVVVVPAAGGAVEQLTFDHGQSWPNAWSPDGEWIAFAGERNSVWNLWAVSRRTHETRQLTHFKGAVGYVRWPAWSPDGHRIIFERNQVHGAVWMTRLP